MDGRAVRFGWDRQIVVTYDGTIAADLNKGKYANALALFDEGAVDPTGRDRLCGVQRFGWGVGQAEGNTTKITTPDGRIAASPTMPSTGDLIDFATGADTGVNLTVAGGEYDGVGQADDAYGCADRSVRMRMTCLMGSWMRLARSRMSRSLADSNLVLTLGSLIRAMGMRLCCMRIAVATRLRIVGR